MIYGTPEYKRLETCFENVARGIFYHHFRATFKGELRLNLGYLDNGDKNSATFTKFIKHRAELDLKGGERFGNNPGVFYYQFAAPDTFGILLLKLFFFEGTDVYVAFIPDGVEKPRLLAMELIEGGVKSYIRLEDKVYEFS